MPLAQGTSKVVAYKKETAWGTLPGATLGKILRRVSAAANLVKETFESNEIRTDRQVADLRHGVQSAEISLEAELSPGTYADFFAAILHRDFTANPVATGASITVALALPNVTLTRAAGSYLTDGFKIGQVVRLTAGAFNAANLNNNALVLNVTATVLTVLPLQTVVPFVAEGPIASATVTGVGKSTLIPLSAHTNDSFTFEEWYADIAQSEVYTGAKPNSISMQIPSSGLVTASFGFMGRGLAQTGTSQYFTSPTAASTSGLFSAATGAVVLNGAASALIQSIDVTIEREAQPANVVGSNLAAEMFTGRVRVSGNMSLFFENATIRNAFRDETVADITVALTTGSGKADDFMTITIPRAKVNTFTKEDQELGISVAADFVALLDISGGAKIASTLAITDSLA